MLQATFLCHLIKNRKRFAFYALVGAKYLKKHVRKSHSQVPKLMLSAKNFLGKVSFTWLSKGKWGFECINKVYFVSLESCWRPLLVVSLLHIKDLVSIMSRTQPNSLFDWVYLCWFGAGFGSWGWCILEQDQKSPDLRSQRLASLCK